MSDESKGYESHNVNNNVTVNTKYGELNGSAGYTTEGVEGVSVAKDFAEYSGGVIKWDITINNLKKDSTNVTLQDNSNELHMKHDFTKDVYVNDVKVVENGVITTAGANVFETGSVNDSAAWLLFKQSFVQDNDGAPIHVRIETKPDPSTLSQPDRIY